MTDAGSSDGPAASRSRSARWRGRAGPIALLAVGAAAAAAFAFERRAELAPAGRGAELAARSGCFACHGQSELDRRGNFRRANDGSWRPRAIPSLWDNGIDDRAVLIDWIANGVPAAEAKEHERLFMRMPAYRDVLPEKDIDAIAAWILAQGLTLSKGNGNGERPVDSAALRAGARLEGIALLTAGDRLSRQHGCYQCHGELGQGGVRNPNSFKGYIPGFFGRDFRKLTAGGDAAEIRHWIDEGRGRAIEEGWTGRLARRFFEGQTIGMPAYRERLTEAEKQVLVDYLLWLNARGPLSAQDVEEIAQQLTTELSKT